MIKTHYSIRQAGQSDNGAMTTSNSLGPCCKMFFPCDETSGTTMTDAAGGIQISPGTISFGTTNAVTALATSANNVGIVPDAGTIPDIANKDFILFSVNEVVIAKAWSSLRLGESVSGDCLRLADSDALEIYESGSVVGDCEISHPLAPGEKQSHAMIRNGNYFTQYLNNKGLSSLDPGHKGIYMDPGDNFGVPDPATLRGPVDTSYESISGYWRTWDSWTPDLPSNNRIMLGVHTAPAPHWFLIALYVFEDGLPSDYITALNWMTTQAFAGNKVSYPGWISLL